METFVTIPVQAVVKNTQDAITIVMHPDESQKKQLQYHAGQYLTLKLEIEGQTVRRAYSLSSSPLEDSMSITVKKVKNGLVSNYLFHHAQKGMSLNVMPPMGDFTFHKADAKGKSYFMFAGGSGITPIYSNLKTILNTEPQSKVFLCYANFAMDSIIFYQEIRALQKQFSDRLVVKYVLENHADAPTFFFQNKPKPTDDDVWKGRVAPEIIHDFLAVFRPQHRNTEYFICGPTPMMQVVNEVLSLRGVPKERIKIEKFNTENTEEVSADAPITAHLTVHLHNEIHTVPMRENQTVIDALIAAKLDAPYACRTGSCATCIGKCTKGEVKMRANSTLDAIDIQEGYVLTCQTVALTDEIEIQYM